MALRNYSILDNLIGANLFCFLYCMISKWLNQNLVSFGSPFYISSRWGSRSLISLCEVQFGSLQLLSHVCLFVTPWTAARQASLSITNSRSLLKLMSIESVMPSNYLILCRPLLLLPSIFPSIRVFSNESVLLIRWPKFWSFRFSINLSNEYSGLISLRFTGLISLLSKRLSRIFSSTTV